MPINKKFIYGFLFFLGFIFLHFNKPFAAVESSYWTTQKSQHFIIYYNSVPQDYVTNLVNSAEKYYNSIVDNLGFRRFNFWSWDNRAKIYLYPTRDDYLKDTKRSAWSGAAVNVSNKTIQTFIGQDDFFDSILPHEMTHIIFREFIGKRVDLPLWLDEGIAASQETNSLIQRIGTVKNLVRNNLYIDFKDLVQIKDYSLVVPQTFYAESASLVKFLIEKYRKDKFLDFSRKLKEGIRWKQALMNIYDFKDFSELELKWKDYYSDK